MLITARKITDLFSAARSAKQLPEVLCVSPSLLVYWFFTKIGRCLSILNFQKTFQHWLDMSFKSNNIMDKETEECFSVEIRAFDAGLGCASTLPLSVGTSLCCVSATLWGGYAINEIVSISIDYFTELACSADSWKVLLVKFSTPTTLAEGQKSIVVLQRNSSRTLVLEKLFSQMHSFH